jgi:hypothetical protein
MVSENDHVSLEILVIESFGHSVIEVSHRVVEKIEERGTTFSHM